MNDPRDDDLRAMLETRADRAAITTEHEVRAAVREAIRGPGGGTGIGFGMLPVRASRGSSTFAGWTAIGIVAVVMLAVAGSNLGGISRPSGAAGPVGSVEAPVASSAARTPAASAAGTPVPSDAMLRELRLADFRVALGAGTLDGSVVVLSGVLREVAVPCPGGGVTPCIEYALGGLDGVVVTWSGQITTSGLEQGPGATPLGPDAQALVVVPEAGQLRLLGRLPGDLASPTSLSTFMNRRSLIANDPFVLVPLAGWLVVGGIHSCPVEGPGATPCPGPGPTLTGTEPFPEGLLSSDAQLQVAIAPDAPGFESGQIVTAGPFLLRTSLQGPACVPGCRGGIGLVWELVARYDPRLVYRIVP